MADSEDDYECTWNEMLPSNPMFERLRKVNSPPVRNGNIICDIRGDLFVWDEAEKVLLTTNLKRLMAYHSKDDQIFQILRLSKQPESSVVRLLPDGNGVHIALQCQNELIVVRLFHLKGEGGEFAGGGKSVLCKAFQIAGDFFKVHHEFVKLLQVEWHQTTPGVLIFLTSDNVFRLVNLANPDFAFLSIPLLSGSASEISLKDPMLNFCLLSNTAFVLQDGGDVYKVPLVSKATSPTALGMHPPAEDNYGSDASSLLVLSTDPPCLVIANGNGVLHHCVYLDAGEEMEDGEEKSSSGYPSEMLYVVESIALSRSESSGNGDSPKPVLVPDPVDVHTYYVVHVDGVYIVTLSWLSKLDMFTAADFRSDAAKSSLTHLLATEPGISNIQSLAVICEPLLGFTLIGLTINWECLTMPLPRSERVAPVAMDDIGKVMRHRHHADRHSSEFEKTIHDTLNPQSEKEGKIPLMRSFDGKKELSQQECYQFLASAVKHLQNNFLLRQKSALELMRDKVERLCRQKEQIISDLMKIKDDTEDMKEGTENIEFKLDQMMGMQKILMKRVEQIVYRVESKSPFLSEAEECMKSELEGLEKHMKVMKQRLTEAKRKFALCADISGCSPKIDLSSQHTATILRTLTDSGGSIKTMMQTVRGLRAVTPT